MEGREWVLTYGAFVDVIPHLHADQHYPNVQWSVKLMKQASFGDHVNENLKCRVGQMRKISPCPLIPVALEFESYL